MTLSEDRRGEVINYIKKTYYKAEKVPTIRSICDSIKGVNRTSFYIIFPGGLGEACEAAGVPIPEKRIKSTIKASKIRAEKRMVTEKEGRITLTPELTKNLRVLEYLEGKDPLYLLDEFFENDRVLRREYDLNIEDVSRLTNFMKDCKKAGIKKEDVLNSLNRFISMGIQNLDKYRFNLLLNLRNDMMQKNWNFEHIQVLYRSKEYMYRQGYEKCLIDAKDEIIKVVSKYINKEISKFDPLQIAIDVDIELKMKSIYLN